jgi:hypothetical protein
VSYRKPLPFNFNKLGKDFINLACSYNDELQIILDHPGEIYRGKDAWDTPVGNKYASHLHKSNKDVIGVMMERKNLALQLADKIQSSLKIPDGVDLLPGLASVLYGKIFKENENLDTYFSILKEMESNGKVIPEIPAKYIEYFTNQTQFILDEMQSRINLTSKSKNFHHFFYEMLNHLIIDLSSFRSIFLDVEFFKEDEPDDRQDDEFKESRDLR